MIPQPETVLAAGDEVLALASAPSEKALRDAVVGEAASGGLPGDGIDGAVHREQQLVPLRLLRDRRAQHPVTFQQQRQLIAEGFQDAPLRRIELAVAIHAAPGVPGSAAPRSAGTVRPPHPR